MSDDESALYSFGFLAHLVLIGYCFVSTWTGTDRNLDGTFTISDIRMMLGQALTVPYRWAYGLLGGVFHFFEVGAPALPTWKTSLAGLLFGYAFALVGGGVLFSVIGGIAATVAHNKRTPEN